MTHAVSLLRDQGQAPSLFSAAMAAVPAAPSIKSSCMTEVAILDTLAKHIFLSYWSSMVLEWSTDPMFGYPALNVGQVLHPCSCVIIQRP